MDLVTVVSPHQDDGGFSLAMAIHATLSAGHRARIVNCFTISDYAPHGNARSVEAVRRIRRMEDREFAARIGPVELVDLEWQDAPLRLGCPVAAVRRRKVGGRERDEAARIAGALAEFVDGVLLVPLGLGAHIDHLVAREAGIRMARAGYAVGFYEDLPYAAELRECCILRTASGVARRIGEPLEAALIRDGGGTTHKRFGIEAYASQVSAEQLQSIIDYGERRGGCERLWITGRLARVFPVPVKRTETAPGSILRCARHYTADRARAVYRRCIQLTLRGGVNVPQPN